MHKKYFWSFTSGVKLLQTNSTKCAFLFILFLSINACSYTIPVQKGWMPHYDVVNDTTLSQTKEKVTVKISPINAWDVKDYPELFFFQFETLNQRFLQNKQFTKKAIDYYFPPDKDDRYWCYTFGTLPEFKVSIMNETGHILRMKDARLYLVMEDQEPVAALSQQGQPQLVKTKILLAGKEKTVHISESFNARDASLLDYITRLETSYYESFKEDRKKLKKGERIPDYPFGLMAGVYRKNFIKYKLINDIGREVLPGFSLTGILCFPYSLKLGQKFKIMFYDVTTETDAAGNPTKKTQFEFGFTYNPKFVMFDSDSQKWRETKPDEEIEQ